MSDAIDGRMRELGLSAPARRALAAIGVISPDQLGDFTWEQLKDLHGIGPSTLPKIEAYLKA
jgi:hypothetical protein